MGARPLRSQTTLRWTSFPGVGKLVFSYRSLVSDLGRTGPSYMTSAVPEDASRDLLRERHVAPLVSVIIATRNRPDDLARCLASIQSLMYENFEVLVVDQSTPDLSRLPAQLEDKRFQFITDDAVGKEHAQNRAINLASGEIFAFTDDDCTVPPSWLTRAVEVVHQEVDVGVIYGAVAAPVHDHHEYFIPTFAPEHYARRCGNYVRAYGCGMGANMIVPRQAMEILHGFQEELGPGGIFRSGGDWEFAFRALRAGMTVVQDPENVVMHYGARSHAGGQVRRLILNNYFGLGAGYALHIKRGDFFAALTLSREVGSAACLTFSNALRGKRLLAGRLVYLVHGALLAFAKGTKSNKS